MPATYTHYRFGNEMLNLMPADISRTVKRFRRLYDVGLQGADPFFYYKPMVTTKIGQLGYKYHLQTGKEFFSRVCRSLRLEPSEAAQAYLYGVLCHYTLDLACHPLINEVSRDGTPSHTRVEGEFDRYLLDMDGGMPHSGSLTKHMRLTDSECEIVSRFYPGAEGKHIKESLWGMAKIHKMLELPHGPVRSAIAKTIGAGSKDFRGMLLDAQPDPACQPLNEPLMERYRQAAQRFPDMLVQLGAHLTYNAPLGEDFNPIFW